MNPPLLVSDAEMDTGKLSKTDGVLVVDCSSTAIKNFHLGLLPGVLRISHRPRNKVHRLTWDILILKYSHLLYLLK